MAKVVSFDMDGTLVVRNLVDEVWFEGVPHLYSERHGVSFDQALSEVRQAYDEVGPERIEWYDLEYWFKRFDLKSDRNELLKQYQSSVRLYPEVPEVLETLNRKYRLVLVSAAARDFIDLVIESTGLDRYLIRTFSSISDFKLVGKSPELFLRVCTELGISPNQMVHVGDQVVNDFEVPRAAGAHAVLLDREGKTSGPWVVHDLRALPAKLENLSG